MRKEKNYLTMTVKILDLKNITKSLIFLRNQVYLFAEMGRAFGRTSLESSSCGCAVIITNRGLPEITNGVILENSSNRSF